MQKIIGIFIMTLFFAIAIFPAIGTINESIDYYGFLNYNDNVEWQRTYGGDEADKFWDVQETDDGGFIASGTTEIDDNHCPWVVKVDSEGNEMWDWTTTNFNYGDTLLDITYSWCDEVKQTSDGGYIIGITGFLFTYNEEEYGVGGLLKLDSNGEEEWLQIYGDTFEIHTGVEFIQEIEDGYVCVGSHGEAIGGNSPDRDTDICLFRTDNMGEIIWQQEYDYGDKPNWARGFCFTSDGGYLLVGAANFGEPDEWIPIMIKTDSNGNEEWHKTFEDIRGTFWNVYQTSDNGYVTAGSDPLCIIKTDSSGTMIWNKTFNCKGLDYSWDLDPTDDGGYIASIMVDINGMNTDGWVIKIDNQGNVEWKHIYGEDGGKQYFMAACPTSDGGCVASGMSGGWDSSRSDALLVKYALMENQRPNKPVIDGPSKGKPDTEYTFTASTIDSDGDSLQYIWDWGDGNCSDILDTDEATYSWTHKDTFEVIVMAIDENGGESDWSDPLVFSTPRYKINYNQILDRLLSRFQFLDF
jgi:hypothetical protein